MADEGVAHLVEVCRALALKGYAPASSGNVSLRSGDRIYLTPTGAALANLSEEKLALCDLQGRSLNSARPTKEAAFHLAVYRRRPDVSAVVHTHPTHVVASSALAGAGGFVPAVAPQFVMRAGRVPILPYRHPGSPEIAADLAEHCGGAAVVLQNHGAVTFAASLERAVGVLDELEEACRLWLLVREGGRVLSEREEDELIALQRGREDAAGGPK